MTRNVLSEGDKLYVSLILCIDVSKFLCVSGTAFGRPVVPEVCRIKAVSSSDASEGALAAKRAADALSVRVVEIVYGAKTLQLVDANGASTPSADATEASEDATALILHPSCL